MMTWIFGLLLLASFLYPVISASAHHSAAQTNSIEARDGSTFSGLRPALHAGPRAGDRGMRVEHGSGGGKVVTFPPAVPLDAISVAKVSGIETALPPALAAPAPFLARGPPQPRG